VVLTTNHPEAIPPILLRPGRVDDLIEVGPPDGEAAERLVRLYGRGLLAPDIDFTHLRDKLGGKIPAVVREVVERAKLYALADGQSAENLALQANNLSDAADGMEPHLRLLAGPQQSPEREVEILARYTTGTNGNGVHAHS